MPSLAKKSDVSAVVVLTLSLFDEPRDARGGERRRGVRNISLRLRLELETLRSTTNLKVRRSRLRRDYSVCDGRRRRLNGHADGAFSNRPELSGRRLLGGGDHSKASLLALCHHDDTI